MRIVKVELFPDRKSELYRKFYKRYNKYRDKLILAYLKRLRAKSKVPLTMENKDKVLKDRARYERFAKAYWDARLNNRPFITPKPEYVRYWDSREKEVPGARRRWQYYVQKVWNHG